MSFQPYFVRQTGFPNNFTGNFFCLRVLCCLRCVNQLPKVVCVNIFADKYMEIHDCMICWLLFFELALDRNMSILLVPLKIRFYLLMLSPAANNLLYSSYMCIRLPLQAFIIKMAEVGRLYLTLGILESVQTWVGSQ